MEVAEAEVEPINLALQQRPGRVLLLHAYRSGRPWLLSQGTGEIPYAVLMTGTDMNQDLNQVDHALVIARILSGAGAVIVQNRLAHEELQRSGNPWINKLRLLPPGIILGNDHYPIREKLKLHSADLLMLHPASIRPVKGNLELLQLSAEVLECNPRLHLAFCAPILDPNYGERFLAALKGQAQASYLGEIPCVAMPDVLRQSDLILNNSSSEGMSNALVEAVCIGRPILARNIPGNRTLVKEGINGMMFTDQQSFKEQASKLLADPALLKSLSQPETERFSAAREGERLSEILASLGRQDPVARPELPATGF